LPLRALQAEILRCKDHFGIFSCKKRRRRFCTIAISIARGASDQAQVSAVMLDENERAR